MAAFAIVFISVLVIELHSINAVPVPELSVKLLCELLCEHCNGVSSMESGHCNCEVPEAHFKDNFACLERVQISAAEMNLKLTHFKNIRHERSVDDLLGKMKSKALEDSQINYSRGYNEISDKPLTPPTPNTLYVDKSEDQAPEHRELFVKRSINVVPAPENEKVDGQSPEHELFRKPSINNNFETSSIKALYSKKSITAMPSSRVLSGSKSRSAKLSVFCPQRKKRSYTQRVKAANKEDGTISSRNSASTNSNENYDVRVNVQADISIPALQFNQVYKKNSMNSKLQENDDLQSQISPSAVPDKSSMLKSEPSSLKQTTFAKMFDNIKSFVSTKPTDAAKVENTIVSNKSRSEVEQKILNTGTSVASKPTDLIDESNSLFKDTKHGLPSLTTLKLPTLTSQYKLRASNETQLLQRNKLNELKLRLTKLLSREQPRTPLQRNELLKGQKSPIESTPLAKLVFLSSPPKCNSLFGRSKNRSLGGLVTKGTINDVKLKGQGEGMTLLEKIKNNQLKLKQNILRGKSEEYLVNKKAQSGCQFKNENSGLPLKLNPLIPIETKARESTVECDYDNIDVNVSPMNSIDTRSNSPKTESVGEQRIDTPLVSPVSQESHSSSFIPTAFSDDSFVSTTLPSEPTDNVGKIGLNNEVNENAEITRTSQLTSELPKNENDSNISSADFAVTDISIIANTTESIAAHTDSIPGDSDDNQHTEKSQQLLETTSEVFPFVTSNIEAVSVSSLVPVSGSEARSMQSDKPSQSTNDNIMDTTQTLSNHPHFVNHHESNFFTKTPNYFPPVFMPPPLGNNIHLTPEETYRGMFDPTLFHNDMQRINYPPFLVRNDLSNTERDSVLNRPVVIAPNNVIPFDHPSRLMTNYNEAPDRPNHPIPNEQSGMMMRAFVPGESYPNNPVNLPPSSVFILKPLLTPNGNIPYPELLNKIRTGNAIIQIHPINLKDVDNSRM